MKKIIIVACSLNNVIGRSNKLPWANDEKYKGDLRRFKELTENNTVIMGRKTFESIGHNPLKNRRNIVVSKTSTFKNIETSQCIADALANCNKDDNIFFIGGSQLYRFALSYTDEIDMTIIPEVYSTQNRNDEFVYFPEISDRWKLTEQFVHPYNKLLEVKKFVRIV